MELIQSTMFRQGHVPSLLRLAPAQALLAGLSGLVPMPPEGILPRLHRGCNPESGASRSSGCSGGGWTVTWTKCSGRSHVRQRQAEHPSDFSL